MRGPWYSRRACPPAWLCKLEAYLCGEPLENDACLHGGTAEVFDSLVLV